MEMMRGSNIVRGDGSIVAVLETMYTDGTPYLRLRVVEDSDWLSVEDMKLVATVLSRLVLGE